MYSKDCFSGFVFFFGLFSCFLLFLLEDLAFVSSVLCFRCSHFSLLLLNYVCCLCAFYLFIALSCIFSPWGVLVVPGGSFGRPWKCLGSCRGFLVGPWDILKGAWGLLGGSLGVLGGACGIPRSSWSVLGASLGLLGDPWRHLGGPWLLLGSPWATPWGFLWDPWGVLVGT